MFAGGFKETQKSFKCRFAYKPSTLIFIGILSSTLVNVESSNAQIASAANSKSSSRMLALIPKPDLSKRAVDAKVAALATQVFNDISAGDATNAFIDANNAAKTNSKSYVVPYLKGAALMTLYDYAEALKEFTKATVLESTSADAHFMVAQAHRMSGHFSEAVNEYRETLKYDPKFAVALALIGECSRMQGSLWKARLECKDALQLDPQLALAHTITAETFLSEDKIESCSAEYEAAISIAPDDPYPHFRFGQALGTLKRWEEAERELKKAIALDPKYSDPELVLGKILVNQEKYNEALPFLLKAVALAPNDVDTHINLAQVYSKRGEHEFSVQQYKMARKLRPKSLRIQKALATELSQTQHLDEAIAEMSLVAQQMPLDEQVKLALNALLQLKRKELSTSDFQDE
jgi:tetratricopeptide (TPR) repeat protein